MALLVVAVWRSKPDVLGIRWAPGTLGFVQIYHGLDRRLGGLQVSWSLCVEVTLYAFLPLWAWAMSRTEGRTAIERYNRELLGLAGLIVFGVLCNALLVIDPGAPDALHHNVLSISLLHYVDVFAGGMLVAAVSVRYQRRRLPPALVWIDRFPGLSWLVAGIALVIMARGIGLGDTNFGTRTAAQRWEEHYLVAVVGLGLVLPAVFGDQRRGLVRKVLAWPGLLWIGTLSYAIYLWHTTVLSTLSKSGIPGDVARATGLQGWIVYVVLGLAGTTVIALLSQRFVEDPAMSLKRRNPFQAREGESLAPAFRLALAGGGLAMTALGLVGTRYATVDAFLVLAGAVILGSMVLRARWTAARLPAPTLLAAALAAAAVALAGVVLGSPRTTAAQGLLPVAHLAETVGGGRIQLFVNGRRVAETTYRGRPDAGVGPLEVGAYASRRNWSGVIDEVALYRSVLTPTDVAEHYQLGLVGVSEYESTVAGAPGVMSYWRLSDPPGADARNVVSGGRAGTVSRQRQASRARPGRGPLIRQRASTAGPRGSRSNRSPPGPALHGRGMGGERYADQQSGRRRSRRRLLPSGRTPSAAGRRASSRVADLWWPPAPRPRGSTVRNRPTGGSRTSSGGCSRRSHWRSWRCCGGDAAARRAPSATVPVSRPRRRWRGNPKPTPCILRSSPVRGPVASRGNPRTRQNVTIMPYPSKTTRPPGYVPTSKVRG